MDLSKTYAWESWGQAKRVAGTALLNKLFELLDVLATSGGSTLPDLIEATGLPRATVYRILAAATAKGYVRQEGRGNALSLGFRFIELAQNVWSSTNIVTAGAGELKRLRDISGETAYLSVFEETVTIALGRFESAHKYRSAGRLGVRRPLHVSSQGKSILAQLPKPEAQVLISSLSLERFTDLTITDADELIAHLAIVRERGYAIDDEESLIGVRCVGSAIVGEGGRPIGAISISGPTYRVTRERAALLGPVVMQAARDIEILIRRSAQRATVDAGMPAAHPGCAMPALHGASPVASLRSGGLCWIDRLAPALHVTDASTSTLRPDGIAEVECLLAAEDRLLAFGQGHVMTASENGKAWLDDMPTAAQVTAVTVHPDGTVYAAAFSDKTGMTVVGMMNTDFDVEPTWTLQGRISAMTWDPSGRDLYATVPQRGVIYVLARNSSPRVFTRIFEASGKPYGIAIDAEGHLWVGLYDGWGLVRLTDIGEFDQVFALPVPRPTGMAFDARDKRVLHITTARLGLDGEVLQNAPLAGRLLSMKCDVDGFVPPTAML